MADGRHAANGEPRAFADEICIGLADLLVGAGQLVEKVLKRKNTCVLIATLMWICAAAKLFTMWRR